MLRLIAAGLVLAACSFDGGGVGSDADVVVDPDARTVAPDADVADPDAVPIDGPPADPPGILHAKDATGAVTIDGIGDEFAAAGAVAIGWDIENGERYLTTHASYSPSARLEVQAIHDASNLYFFARVLDATHQVDSTELWDDDGVAIYLDVLGDALGPYAADDHELIVRGDAMWGDFGPIGDPAVLGVARATIAGGYALEIQVEKASLSGTVGASMGFDALITDDDGWGDSGYDAYSVWFLSTRPACVTCCTTETDAQPWCDTTTFGTLVLD